MSRAREDLPELLTTPEVARWLRTTRAAVYAGAERGSIPGAVRLGRRLLFDRGALLRWLEQGRVPFAGGRP